MSQVRRLQIAEGVEIDPPSAVEQAHTITDAATWNGTAYTQTYTVSAADVPDCRYANWVFKDSNHKQVAGAVIDSPSATQVRVTFSQDFPPAAGTHYLVGAF